MTLQEIYAAAEEKLALIDAIDALASAEEGREITDEEVERKQKLLDEHDALVKRAKQMEAVEAAKTEADARNKSAVTPPSPAITAPADASDESKFASLGDQVRAVIGAARNPSKVDSRLLEMRAPSGMSTGVDSDGGYAVQTDFVSGLIEKMHETGMLAAKCWTVPITDGSNGVRMNAIAETSRVDGSRGGGIRVYRKAEAAQYTSSKMTLREIKLDLEDMTGLCYLTGQQVKDAGQLTTYVEKGFGAEFGFKMDDELINGDGAGRMLGVLNSPSLVTQAKETGQGAATVLFENIVAMWGRSWPRSRPKLAWYINQEVEGQLDKMYLAAGTAGVPVYLPLGGISTQSYATLKGRPVIVCEQCAALGTVGDIVLADFSEYLLIEKAGIQQDTSIHIRFDYNEEALRFILRNNGQPLWDDPLTPYKGTKTLSPFVALATRS